MSDPTPQNASGAESPENAWRSLPLDVGFVVAMGVREGAAPGRCYVGRIEAMDARGVRLALVDWLIGRFTTWDVWFPWDVVTSALCYTPDHTGTFNDAAENWQTAMSTLSESGPSVPESEAAPEPTPTRAGATRRNYSIEILRRAQYVPGMKNVGGQPFPPPLHPGDSVWYSLDLKSHDDGVVVRADEKTLTLRDEAYLDECTIDWGDVMAFSIVSRANA